MKMWVYLRESWKNPIIICCTHCKIFAGGRCPVILRSIFINVIDIAKPRGRAALLMCRLLVDALHLFLSTCDTGEQVLQSAADMEVQQKTQHSSFFFFPPFLCFYSSNMQTLMLQNASFIISLLSQVIKFHLSAEWINATDQLWRKQPAWKEKESVSVVSEAFSLALLVQY